MALGDKVIVLLDLGDRTEEKTITADAVGRKVEFRRDARNGLIEVEVLGQTNKPVRRYEFLASRVVSIEDRPRTSTDAAREKREAAKALKK